MWKVTKDRKDNWYGGGIIKTTAFQFIHKLSGKNDEPYGGHVSLDKITFNC